MWRFGSTFFLLFISLNIYCQVKNIESPDGLNIYYYPNGQVSSKGNMKEGNPDGLWTSYYVNGVLKSEGVWKSGQLDSVWQFYNEDAQLIEKINYYGGKKNGYYYSFKKLDTNPNLTYLASQELFYDNKRNGLSDYYFEDGQVQFIIPYKDGQKHGTAKEFNKKGTIITLIEYRYGKEIDREAVNRYTDSLPDGLWKEFYPNGKLKSERNYTKGVLNGLSKEYDLKGDLIKARRYEEGVIKDSTLDIANEINIVEEFFNLKDSAGNLIKKQSGGYIDGVPVGTHRTFDSLGRVVSSRLFDSQGNLTAFGILDIEGNRVGEWIYYYDGGGEILKSKGSYVDDKRSGEWEFYYFEGGVEQKGIFVAGRPHGTWYWYYENGSVKRQETYKNGRENGVYIEYDEYGKVIEKGNYNDGVREGEWFIDYDFHTEKGNYYDDQRNGLWVFTYKNGAKYFEGNFTQGYPDGYHTFYYKNGKIKEKQFYAMGLKQKNWEYYDYYGTLIKILTFENDVLVKIDGVNIVID